MKIQLKEGDTEEVISDAEAERYDTYNIQIYEGTVQFDHTERNVEDGLELGPGTFPLSNLQGDGIYFKCTSGPFECRIRPAAAAVSKLPDQITIEEANIGGGGLSKADKQDQIIQLLEQIEENTN